MKWIRWPGLIAFLVLGVLIFGVWWLFVDIAIRRMIEFTGTKLVGAKVELDHADLSFLPLGLSLTRLQVTNPDEPMTNAVETTRIVFSLNAQNLLRRKWIIEEMTIDGVRFDTPRRTSGAVVQKQAVDSEKETPEGLKLPTFEIPNVREILKQEELHSLKLVETVRAETQTDREKWEKKLKALPDKAKFMEYKSRIEKIKSSREGGLEAKLGAARDLIAVQKEVRSDLDLIKTARTELTKDVSLLRNRLEEAKESSLADVRRLAEKYSLSPRGLSNMTQMLLGEQIGRWTRSTLRWYERLKPLFAKVGEQKKGVEVVKPVRGKGVNVRFKEQQPLPDFLISTARVSIEIPAGAMAGQVRNITPDQDILGAPLVFKFSGENLQGLSSAVFEGEFNRVNPTKPKDTVNVRVQKYQIKEVPLSKSENWPIVLKEALVDLRLDTTVAGEALDSKLTTDLQSVKISATPSNDAGQVSKAVAAVLSDIKAVNLKADVTGTLKDYDLRLGSDLDRVIQDAVGKQVKEQASRFESELRSAVSERLRGPLDELNQLIGLDGISKELNARVNEGTGLLGDAKASGTEGLKLPF